nr:piwi-like protein Siwi isoform X2 [Procambarus clarkii]
MARVGLEPGAVGGGDNGGREVGNGRSVGRGVQRGRREISQIVWTKPSTITVKKGGAGQSINVLTNYFNLVKKQNWMLCLYHVDFSPDEDRTRERKQLLRQHQEVLGANYLFDGMQLYLPVKLGAEVTELASKRESDESIYTVRLKFIKELSPLDSQYLQLMNIILRRCMDFLGMQVIGRNYFSSKDKVRDERYKVEIWPGVCTSIRHHENSLLLNVDVMHKFLRAETAYDVLRKCGQANLVAEAGRRLLGSIVMTQYNERTYRVDELDWQLHPTSKFSYRGGEITYMEYYEKNYQVKIRDVQQPMIMSKPKKRDLRRGSGCIYLVPELCTMTGLTDDMRADFNMMKDLAQYMRMGPDKRVKALLRYNKDLAANVKAKQEMTHWGLEVSPSLVSVQGRMLPEEQIIVGGQSISFNRRTSDWSRETRSMILNTPVDLKHWAIIYPIKFSDDARELVTHLQRVGKPMGMNLANPSTFVLRADGANDYVGVLNQCAGMELVMAILPNNRADRYNAFKRHLSIKMGIPSQCILSRTLFKKQRLMSVATKVAIQMNCKLGGEPWSVAIPIKNAMVIGYDAYHDKMSRGASYGAVVSSLNQPWTRYLSQVARHFNQEELTDNFALGVKNAVTWYQKENGCYPNMIVVYRDGVGEGQIEYVKEHEIAAIKRCFEEALPKPPRLGFIIVSKRINTRMFLENRGQIENPLPGTVIDDVITLPERYDFFLVSQSINQGTVSPTSFNIIEDTTGLQPDHMQRLAYKLCHTYFNWQGTVRVPAPCMFAHKLAYMTGQTVNDRPHQDLVDRLWYL